MTHSGNVVQERFLHDHAFLGHIDGSFTFAIEDEAFDEDESCECLDGCLKDSLHQVTSPHTFGKASPTKDVEPPAVSHMLMLARHRDYCVQTVDRLLQAAK